MISETRESNAALRFKKVASDLRFRAAISEPKTPSFFEISGDLAPSTRTSPAIARLCDFGALRRALTKVDFPCSQPFEDSPQKVPPKCPRKRPRKVFTQVVEVHLSCFHQFCSSTMTVPATMVLMVLDSSGFYSRAIL